MFLVRNAGFNCLALVFFKCRYIKLSEVGENMCELWVLQKFELVVILRYLRSECLHKKNRGNI